MERGERGERGEEGGEGEREEKKKEKEKERRRTRRERCFCINMHNRFEKREYKTNSTTLLKDENS